MESGVQIADVVDVMALDPASGEIVLIMTHDGTWDKGQEDIDALAEKTLNYVRYAFGGQLAADFPEQAGKRIRLQLDCRCLPPSPVLEFLDRAEAALIGCGGRLLVNIVAEE